MTVEIISDLNIDSKYGFFGSVLQSGILNKIFFAGLRDKLAEKYLQNGRIIPPAPDKSIIGMTKIKMSKEEDNTDQSGTVS